MTEAPSVLLLDDGELDRVEGILRELDTDCLRLKGREIGREVTAPRDLLVTSGRRALNEMPRVKPAGDDLPAPTWVCLHGQDFLPLRVRLRDMGVHFLVQAALDQESLRLFLTQLLYSGVERRGYRRLPLGGEIRYRLDGEDHRAKLVELAQDVCRIRTAQRLAVDTALSLFLPPALSGGEDLELPCQVIKRSEAPGLGGGAAYSVLLRFRELSPEAASQLESVATGNQIGTRLTPLAEPPRRGGAPPAAEFVPPDERVTEVQFQARAEAELERPEPEEVRSRGPESPAISERRGESRVLYPQRVQAFTGDGAPRSGLGRDLSPDGIFIEGETDLAEGDRVTLALYGSDPRGEPILVDARVVRDDGVRGVGLAFQALTPEQRFRLEKLAAQLPPLRSLGDDALRIVSQVIRRDD